VRIWEPIRYYYEIKDTDSQETKNFKRYMVERDKKERDLEFMLKYNEIKQMASKNTIDKLKRQITMEEFIKEYSK